MPKNPTRKGFFFWWKGGSHYPIAKISTVEAGSVGEGETPCPVTLLSSLMGKNSPGLPLPRPPAKKKKKMSRSLQKKCHLMLPGWSQPAPGP